VKSSYKLSLFFTQECLRHLPPPRAMPIPFQRLRELGIEKVYLETYRTGVLDEDLARRRRDDFLAAGFEVAGGLCYGVHAEGYSERAVGLDGRTQRYRCCMRSPVTLAGMERVSAMTARVFDEILIDDFYNHDCYCDSCLAAFSEFVGRPVSRDELRTAVSGPASDLLARWADFTFEVMRKASQEHVVGPARAANPKVRVIEKVPEWYDEFVVRGIRLPEFARMFDGIWVGTESRETTERYGAYFNYRWVRSQAGAEKTLGVWFDTLSGYDFGLTMSPAVYVDQARMSVLNGSPELTLFNYDLLSRDSACAQALRPRLAELRQIAEATRGAGHLGLAVAKPQGLQSHGTPDLYIYDTLGNLGLPLKPVALADAASEPALLVTAGELTSDNAAFYREKLRAGATLILTGQAVQTVASGLWGDEGAELLGLDPAAPISAELMTATAFVAPADTAAFGRLTFRRWGAAPVGPIVNLKAAEPLLYGFHEGRYLPIAFERRIGAGRIVGLCFTQCPGYLHDWSNWPGPGALLRQLVGKVLGIELTAPASRIPLFVYDNGRVCMVNLNESPIRVQLAVEPEQLFGRRAEGVRDVLEREQIDSEVKDGWLRVSLLLPGRSLRLVEYW